MVGLVLVLETIKTFALNRSKRILDSKCSAAKENMEEWGQLRMEDGRMESGKLNLE